MAGQQDDPVLEEPHCSIQYTVLHCLSHSTNPPAAGWRRWTADSEAGQCKDCCLISVMCTVSSVLYIALCFPMAGPGEQCCRELHPGSRRTAARTRTALY